MGSTNIGGMNEEEVKARIVVPWLTNRGFSLADLSFETAFSVRIGRQQVPVNAEPDERTLRPRLDILVRRNNRNLLIVETKAAHEPLTDRDRDQAVSYGRLVHPMAPFALVTNGSDFQLYDVVTREPVSHEGSILDGYAPVAPNAGKSDQIGFIAELLPGHSRLGFYGFRTIAAGEEDVLFVPVAQVPSGTDRTVSRTYYYGATRLHFAAAANGFQDVNVRREVLLREICPQLREMIKKGHLDESRSNAMTEELVRGIVRSGKDVFKAIANIESEAGHVSIRQLKDSVREAQLARHFEELIVRQRREAGTIAERWHGDVVSYSTNLSAQDRQLIAEQVARALSSGEEVNLAVINRNLIDLHRRLDWLPDDQALFSSRPSAELAELRGLDGRVHLDDVKEALLRRLGDVARQELDGYRLLVEMSFPTLKQYFESYALMPVTLVLVPAWHHTLDDSGLHAYWCSPRSNGNEVIVAEQASLDMDIYPWSLATAGGPFECRRHVVTGLRSVLWGTATGALEYDDMFGAVRRNIYGRLEHEFREAEKALLAIFGIDERIHRTS